MEVSGYSSQWPSDRLFLCVERQDFLASHQFVVLQKEFTASSPDSGATTEDVDQPG